MTIFTINSENHIAAHGSASEITDKGSEQFTSEKELAQLAADWPGSRLVDIWNRIPGLTPVKRFTNRAVATARVLGYLLTFRKHRPSAKRRPILIAATVPLNGAIHVSNGNHMPVQTEYLRRRTPAALGDLI